MFWFVLRNHKKWLVYSWDVSQLDTCLDSKTALDRRNKKPESFHLTDYTGRVYWRKQTFTLPYTVDILNDSKQINEEFQSFLVKQAKSKLISDIALGIWLELLKQFDVYKAKNGFVYLLQLKQEDIIELARDNTQEAKYVLMKEFMDWYSYFDDYELKQNGKKYPITISHSYKIDDVTIPYNYTLALRKAMFGANQWQSIGPDKLLMDWQYDVIRRMWKKTVVFWPRRAGKCVWELGKLRLANGTFVYARDVKVWDKLLASKPSDHKEWNHNNYVTVKDIDKFQKECVEVILDNGMSFVVSSDHRIPTQSTFSKEWRDMNIDNYTLAKDLKPWEDFVPTNNRIYYSHNNNKYKAEWLLVGMFLWDWVNDTWKISCHQQEIADYLLERLPWSTYNNSFIHINQNTIKAVTTRKNDNFSIEERKTFYWLNNMSYNKFIVNPIFWYGNSFKRGMIEWLILSDWYIQIKNTTSNRKDSFEIVYTTTSKQLAKDIQIVLWDLWVFSYLREKKITTQFKSNTNNIAYDVHISDKDSLKKIFRYTNISTKKNFTEALDIINTRDWYTNNTLNLIPLQAITYTDTKKFEINWKWFDNTREKEYNLCRRKADASWLSHRKQYFRWKVVEVKSVWTQNVVHIEVDWDRTYRYEWCLTHNTFLLAFLARREIMAQKMNFQNQYRPVSVLYLGLSDSKNFKVVQYLKGMDKMFSKNAEWMFHYSSDQKMYTFRSGKEILWSITFISTEQKDPWVGDYADLIIIDEAIKVPNRIRELLEPIINNEWAKLLTASTLYYNAPKNWNYDLMLEAEKQSLWKDIYKYIDTNFEQFRPLSEKIRTEEDKLEYQVLVNAFSDANERTGLRYCIDDVEYIPEQRRETEKERLWKQNPQRYYAEYYSRYADEGKVFNYNNCLAEIKKDTSKTYEHITTVHDSALTYDISAVLVWARDPSLRKIVVLDEHEIKKTGYYEDQAKQIKEIIADSVKYTKPQNLDIASKPIWNPQTSDTFFICDGNQKATAELFQMAGVNIDLRITYSANGEWESKSKFLYNEINVPKKILIEITEKIVENGFIVIDTKLKKLLDEFDSYYKTTDPVTGNIKYSKWKSDDFIHAFMMLCYFFYEKLNLKHELVKRTDHKSLWMISKQAVLQIKYQEHLDKLKKKEDDRATKLNQIYFYNHVY